MSDNAVERLLDTLRETFPDAWFMVVPDDTEQLNVPITYDLLWHEATELEFQIEHIQIRQSEIVPALWWGHGKESNRLAYWVDEET